MAVAIQMEWFVAGLFIENSLQYWQTTLEIHSWLKTWDLTCKAISFMQNEYLLESFNKLNGWA